jgi:Bacterial membrane protein YfhO
MNDCFAYRLMRAWSTLRVSRDVLALIIVVSGVSLFHLRGLLPGQTFLPVDLANSNLPWYSVSAQPLQNGLISDPLYQYYPFLVNAVDTIRQEGQWPLWNPRIFTGQPSAADPLAQTFYPVFLLLALWLGVARGLSVGLVLHAALASILTYSYLRSLQFTRQSSMFGAFTYALSGYMVTWFETPFWLSTLSWLPGVLWGFEVAIQTRRLRYVAVAALMLGFAILGGQYSFIVTFIVFFIFYAAGRVLERLVQKEPVRLWPLAAAIAVVAFALLGTALQTLPFAEFLNLSQRVITQGLRDPLPLQQLLTLIVPKFYGNPEGAGSYWGIWNYSEATIYVGLSALCLAAIAPFIGNRFFIFWVTGMTVLLLYFTVGGPGVQGLGSLPLFKYASLHRSVFLLPLFVALLAAHTLSEGQWPARIATTVVLCVSALLLSAALMNWRDVQVHWQELQVPIITAALLLLASLALIGLRGRRLATRDANLAFIALAFFDLYHMGSQYNPAGPIEQLMPPTPSVAYLKEHLSDYRAAPYQTAGMLFGPNVLSIYGISEAGGYSSVLPTAVQRLVQAGDPKGDATGSGFWMRQNGNMVFFSRPSTRLLDLLQVAYVITPGPRIDTGVRAVYQADGCEGDSGEIANGRRVSGSFVVKDTAINRIDFRVRVYSTSNVRGALAIRMWQGTDRARLMLDTKQDSAQLRDRNTFTVFFAPERAAAGQTYVWEVTAAGDAQSTGIGLCALANGQPSFSVYGTDWQQVYEGEVRIYERLHPLPRAYIAYAAEYLSDDGQTISRLLDGAFDPYRQVVVNEKVDLPGIGTSTASPAEIAEYQSTRVVINAMATQPGLLVLGDQFYPGWQAVVDDQPVPIIRVNGTARGVLLPAGQHQVVFQFVSVPVMQGIALGVIGSLVLAAIAAYRFLARK